MKKLIYLIFAAVIITGGMLFWMTPFSQNENAQNLVGAELLPPDLVCMVNDTYMNVEQIPVEVNSKMYYGCCEMCVGKIRENQGNVRFAVDPFSNEKVDKSEAFITLKPGSKKVLYFATENNVNEYFSQR